MQANRDEFERYVWHALGAVAEVCGGATRLQIMGSRKTKPIVRTRCVFVELLRETVGSDFKDGISIDLTGDMPERYEPISFPTMARIFGHHHSTYVMIHKRSQRNWAEVGPLLAQVKARLAETWQAGEVGR
jgi:hypothetical protein